MNFACLTTMTPGRTLTEQCATIAATGCTGVETILFPQTPLVQWQQELRSAVDDAGLQIVAVIVGGLALYQPGQLPWLTEALTAIHEVGAAALITAEYRAQDPLPLFPPFLAPSAAEGAQVDETLEALSVLVTKLGLPLWLEPITQFESRFWRDVGSVLAVCQRLNNPRIGLVLDTHNLNITEADISASIRQAGTWVRHLHLADNNRRLPGQGHLDFTGVLTTLQEIDYQGWYSFECGGMSDFVAEVQQTIRLLIAASQSI
jgi:sugar phosphate isomerase/epimerase